jgi:hypothetical protein
MLSAEGKTKPDSGRAWVTPGGGKNSTASPWRRWHDRMSGKEDKAMVLVKPQARRSSCQKKAPTRRVGAFAARLC